MVLIIIFSLILLCNALFDYWLISDLKWIDHTKSTFVWLIVYVVLGGMTYYHDKASQAFFLDVCLVWPSVRWLLHDLILNGLRGLKWDYLGKGEKAALTDKLLARLPFHFIWLKAGLLFLFMIISFL